MTAKSFVDNYGGSEWAIGLQQDQQNSRVDVTHKHFNLILSEYIVRFNPQNNWGFYSWDKDCFEVSGFPPLDLDELFFFMVSLGSFIFDERTEMEFILDWIDHHIVNYSELRMPWFDFRETLVMKMKELS